MTILQNQESKIGWRETDISPNNWYDFKFKDFGLSCSRYGELAKLNHYIYGTSSYYTIASEEISGLLDLNDHDAKLVLKEWASKHVKQVLKMERLINELSF